MRAKRLKPSNVWNDADTVIKQSLISDLAASMKREDELAPDEVSASALSQETGKPVYLCYKFLKRREAAGELTIARRVKNAVIFRAVTK